MPAGGNWKELFNAACEGDLELLRYHVRAGVDLNYAHPEFLSTPLVACILAGQTEAALILLEHGADPGLHSEFDGLTPMQAARKMGLRAVEDRLSALGQARPTGGVTVAGVSSRGGVAGWWRDLRALFSLDRV